MVCVRYADGFGYQLVFAAPFARRRSRNRQSWRNWSRATTFFPDGNWRSVRADLAKIHLTSHGRTDIRGERLRVSTSTFSYFPSLAPSRAVCVTWHCIRHQLANIILCHHNFFTLSVGFMSARVELTTPLPPLSMIRSINPRTWARGTSPTTKRLVLRLVYCAVGLTSWRSLTTWTV